MHKKIAVKFNDRDLPIDSRTESFGLAFVIFLLIIDYESNETHVKTYFLLQCNVTLQESNSNIPHNQLTDKSLHYPSLHLQLQFDTYPYSNLWQLPSMVPMEYPAPCTRSTIFGKLKNRSGLAFLVTVSTNCV